MSTTTRWCSSTRARCSPAREGATDYVEADLHEPERILGRPRRDAGLSQPVGLILSGIMGMSPTTTWRGRSSAPVAGLPSGSYLS